MNQSTLNEYASIRKISESVRASSIEDVSNNILNQTLLSEELNIKMEDLLNISKNLNQVAGYYKLLKL